MHVHDRSSPEPHERGIFRFALEGEDTVLYHVYDFRGEKIAAVHFAASLNESLTDEIATEILARAEVDERRHWPRLYEEGRV